MARARTKCGARFRPALVADLRASVDGHGPYAQREIADLISRLLFGIMDPPT
ncbi:hypothetical protein [Acidisphaera sp. L21]|uniref:hypothetical protein n=1 Tax=Acidisphaera sp. L21 TaxID=1641851 RepID=UPI00131AF8B0|nr:hypothetical protein [Acidisphaera sp. L21]